MKLKDIINLINGEFDIVIHGIKLINNTIEPIPEKLLNLKLSKIELEDRITIYLCE